jgi:hypothetical protein
MGVLRKNFKSSLAAFPDYNPHDRPPQGLLRMSAASTSKRARNGFVLRWVVRIGLPLLVLLAISIVGSWFTLTFGAVGGVELCPETFERRQFLYYEIPGSGWQVKKVLRHDVTGKTEEFLTANNHIPKKPKGTQEWHIVEGHRGRRNWKGDAQILVNYFDAQDSSGNPIWLEWSSSNPKLAAVLWPAISRLAIEELYIYVPEVIALAEGTKDADDATSFPAELNDQVAATFYEAALRCQQAGNHEAAVHYLDQAVSYVPSKAEYLKARAESHEALGKADRTKAEVTPSKP